MLILHFFTSKYDQKRITVIIIIIIVIIIIITTIIIIIIIIITIIIIIIIITGLGLTLSRQVNGFQIFHEALLYFRILVIEFLQSSVCIYLILKKLHLH